MSYKRLYPIVVGVELLFTFSQHLSLSSITSSIYSHVFYLPTLLAIIKIASTNKGLICALHVLTI